MEPGISRDDIGFLVNEGSQQEIANILAEYMRNSSMSIDMDILVFTINDIDLINRQVRTKKNFSDNKIELVTKIPSIIYNTSIQYRKSDIRTLRHLFDDPAVTFLNKVNSYDQEMIFDILASDSLPSDFLLSHCSFDLDTFKYAVHEWEQVFLLPVDSQRLKHPIVISKNDALGSRGYMIFLAEEVWDCEKEDVLAYVLEMIEDEKYFIVKGFRPLNWQGMNIEARIYVQKTKKDQWHVNYMMAKNDCRGYSYNFNNEIHALDMMLKEIFPNTYQHIINEVIKYSIRVCSYLEKFLPDLASSYLDFLMDEFGNPFLVYFGGWEQQEWLPRLKDQSVWIQYWGNAFSYLMHLREYKLREGKI